MTRMHLGARRPVSAGRKGQAGFSLTEVAVALSISGLMVGGVLKGVELMEQGRMLQAGALLEQTATGHQMFFNKYKAMPGDLIGANELLADGAVNGNGDGILSVTSNTQANDGFTGEAYQYWSHLAAAGMGPGAGGYATQDTTSAAGSSSAKESVVEGSHFPIFPLGGYMQVVSAATARANTDASTRALTSVAGDSASSFPQMRLNDLYYRVGTQGVSDTASLFTSGAANTTPSVAPVDVARMDLKFDDGRPSSGRLMTTTSKCIGTGTTLPEQNYNYNNASASSSCIVLYRAASSGGSTAIN